MLIYKADILSIVKGFFKRNMSFIFVPLLSKVMINKKKYINSNEIEIHKREIKI